MPHHEPGRRRARWWLATIVACAGVLVVGGYALFLVEVQHARGSAYQNLAAIAELKSRQIEAWRADILGDVLAMASDPFIAESAQVSPGGALGHGTARALRSVLTTLRRTSGYNAIWLLTPAGHVLAAGAGQSAAPDGSARQLIEAATSSRNGGFSDFSPAPGGKVYLDAAAAVRDARGRLLAVVVVRSDAGAALEPLVRDWPTPSHTAETVLIERQGESVVSLIRPLDPAAAPLSSRRPITRADLPTVRAILGQRGAFEGRDYRGVIVFADLRAIAGSPWCLVTKISTQEALAGLRTEAVVISLIVAVLIVLAAAVVGYQYHRQDARLLRRLWQAERHERQLQQEFRTILYSIGDAVVTVDAAGLITALNPMAERLTGWPESEARGRTTDDVIRLIHDSTRAPVPNPIRTVLRDGVATGLDTGTLLVGRDGTERVIMDSAAPVRNEDGSIRGAVMVFGDQTAHQAAIKALRESEERLRLAVTAGELGVYDLDLRSHRATLSPDPLAEFGIDPGSPDLPVSELLARIHPEDRERVGSALAEYVAGRSAVYQVEFRQVDASGAVRWILSTGKIVERAADGTPQRMLGTRMDVTRQKAREARIARLNQLYAALSQCNQAIVRCTDQQELFDQICRGIVEYGGVRMAWIGLVAPETGRVAPTAAYGAGTAYLEDIDISVDGDLASGRGPVGTAIRADAPYWCQDVRHDPGMDPWRQSADRFGWSSIAAVPIRRGGKAAGCLALYAEAVGAFDDEVQTLFTEMAADISFALDNFDREATRERTELAVRESEHRLAMAQRIAGVGFLDWDLRTNLIYWSDEVLRLFGSDTGASEHTIAATTALVHPDDAQLVQSSLERAIAGVQEYDIEHRMVRPDGRVFWVRAQAGLIRDGTGAPERLLGTVLDITTHKNAEMELRLQSAALHATAEAIMITDRAGTIAWTNPAFSALTGYAAEEAIDRNPRDLVKSGTHTDAFYSDLWRTILGGRPWHGEMTNRRKDGTTYLEEQTITAVTTTAGEISHFVAVKRDITKQRHLESQLLQAQKMESVGRLAGGIAHDFNNLVTVINGTADLALQQLRSEDPLTADLRAIREAGDRGASLTHQLLAFSRKQVLRSEVICPAAMAADMRDMLARLLGEHIDIVVAPDPDPGLIRADKGQVEQVIMNLAINARDAMPGGGRLTVETRNLELDDTFVAQHHSVRPGPHVMLVVSDTGAGMDRDTIARIFEPFFTTKEPGKGTGLGLATVYGIVKQSGGTIWVYSEEGVGTTFKIYFPRIEGAPTPATTPPPPARRTRRAGTILVVEDNTALRKVAERGLRLAGFTVLSASSAEDAMSVLAGAGQPVHLIFTDSVLPGMSGREFGDWLATAHPEIRVLFTSGYTDDTALRAGIIDRSTRFIGKPYTLAELVREISAELDR